MVSERSRGHGAADHSAATSGDKWLPQEPGSPGSLSSAVRIQPCWPRGPRGRTRASFVDGAVIYEVLLWMRTVHAGLALGERGVQEALPAQPGRLSVPHSPGTWGPMPREVLSSVSTAP